MNHQSSARPTETSESDGDRLRTLLDNLNNLKGKLQNFTVIDESGQPIGTIQDLILDSGHQLNLVITQSDGHPSASSVLLNGRRIKKVSVQTQSVFVDITKTEAQFLPEYVASEAIREPGPQAPDLVAAISEFAPSSAVAAVDMTTADSSPDFMDGGLFDQEPQAIADSMELDLQGTGLGESEDLMDWNKDTTEGFTDLDALQDGSLVENDLAGFEFGLEDNLAGLDQPLEMGKLSDELSSEDLLGDLSDLDIDFSDNLSDLGETPAEQTGLAFDLSLASDEFASEFTPVIPTTDGLSDDLPELDLELNQPRSIESSPVSDWMAEPSATDLVDLADLDFGAGEGSLDLGGDPVLDLGGDSALDWNEGATSGFEAGETSLDLGVDSSLDFSDQLPEQLPDLTSDDVATDLPEALPDQLWTGELSAEEFSGLDLDAPVASPDLGISLDEDFSTNVDMAIDGDFSSDLGMGELDGVPFEEDSLEPDGLDFDTATDLSAWQANVSDEGSLETDALDFDTATDLSAWKTDADPLLEESFGLSGEEPAFEGWVDSEDLNLPLGELGNEVESETIGSLADLDFEQSEIEPESEAIAGLTDIDTDIDFDQFGSGIESDIEAESPETSGDFPDLEFGELSQESAGWDLTDVGAGLGVAGMGAAGIGAVGGMMAGAGEDPAPTPLDLDDLQLGSQPPSEPETVDQMVPLLEERLQVEYQRHKIGEVIVRKRIGTRIVQVPVRYETLVIEQVSPEHKQLAEVDLSQGESNNIELTGIGGKPTVTGEFKSPKVAAHVLDAIAQALRHRCKSVRIEVELDDSKLQAAYQEWLNQCSKL